MESKVFERHARLSAFPPAQLVYIIYRRLLEHGVRTTFLWVQDKILRRMFGFSPPHISQVLPHLYVGGQHRRRGLTRMRALGISAVVNMREESDDVQRGVALDHYLWLPTTDDTPPTMEDLSRGAAFIAAQIAAGRGVYIHCAAGVGRAPVMAAAYLVRTGMEPAQAWETIRQGRPFIRPTPPQIATLAAFGAAQPKNERSRMVDDVVRDEAVDVVPDVAFSSAVPATRTLSPDVEAWVLAAIEHFTEDPSLTGDLADAEARVVLDWAQGEIRRWGAEMRPQDVATLSTALSPKLRHLRRYIRRTVKLSAASDDPAAILQSLLHSPLAYPEATER
jgi:protein-tyrosine phosphatase